MLVNEKIYERKAPESIAFETTQARYFLFREQDVNTVLKREATQAIIDTEFELYYQEMLYKEQRTKIEKDFLV